MERMIESEKRKALQALFRSARLYGVQVDPPLFRGLARLGFRLPPPVFFRLRHCVVLATFIGVVLALGWWLVVPFVLESSRNTPLTWIIVSAMAGGTSIIGAFYMRKEQRELRARLGLPDRWEDWNPPSSDAAPRSDAAL